MVISFGGLASELSVESKNINRFAWELHEFLSKKSQGGPHGLKIFTDAPIGIFEKSSMKHPSKMVAIFGFYTQF